MSTTTGTIHSNIERISIKDFREKRESYIDNYFTETEIRGGRRPRDESAAGVCAVKESLAVLFSTLLHNLKSINPRDFVISSKESGAPFIETIPAGVLQRIDPEKLYISITHSQKNAYGLCVYREV